MKRWRRRKIKYDPRICARELNLPIPKFDDWIPDLNICFQDLNHGIPGFNLQIREFSADIPFGRATRTTVGTQ
jgi:hypothetical protein